MDYRKHYDALILRARSRSLNGYVERHHVLPRCLGGCDDDSNIVALTPEEHMVAHQLLAKIHRNHSGIAFGALMMATRVSNKQYGWLRRNFSEKMRAIDRSEWKQKQSQTDDHKRKISRSIFKSWENPERRAKQTAAMKGKSFTQEHKAALSAAAKSRKLSDAQKAKIGMAHRGMKHKSPKATCPHCGKTGGSSNMKRYHFDNCKSNPENT